MDECSTNVERSKSTQTEVKRHWSYDGYHVLKHDERKPVCEAYALLQKFRCVAYQYFDFHFDNLV